MVWDAQIEIAPDSNKLRTMTTCHRGLNIWSEKCIDDFYENAEIFKIIYNMPWEDLVCNK